jgi:subtilisin family serine protease
MNWRILIILFFLLLALVPASAQTQYILGTSPASVDAVAAKYGLAVVDELSAEGGVYLVTAPASILPKQLLGQVAADPRVTSFELNATMEASEVEPRTKVQVNLGAIQSGLSDTGTLTFAGATVRNLYVNQPASSLIRLGLMTLPASSLPIVAIIDTGVDPSHSALAGVLMPGYDFTQSQAGIPNELNDLSTTSSTALSQSASVPLSQKTDVLLQQSTVVILDQSTVVILDGNGPLPADFGHGTMVAGLVHLVAPSAQIMPLKAFKSDGSATLSDIISAIYYAADHGANVISMSFDTDTASPHLKQAIAYAQSKGAICVAAAGNEGEQELTYPAGFSGVIGVGSTTPTDGRSVFSNYSVPSVFMAAPGEGLITTYPGNNYAAAWGTSFSTALVTGAVAQMFETADALSLITATDALEQGHPLSESLGLGESRLDVFASCNALQGDHCEDELTACRVGQARRKPPVRQPPGGGGVPRIVLDP